MVRKWMHRLTSTTRLRYMWHHTSEVSRLHNFCSNTVQISMRGTRRVGRHYTGHYTKCRTSSKNISLMRYGSYSNMGQRSTPWITTTRLLYTWHRSMAASKLPGYCSSMVQMSMYGTRMIKHHYTSYCPGHG